jgi:UDP-GlcNAc:undecaprenyl-phosphate GlcNAc-1-phosphate transferase
MLNLWLVLATVVPSFLISLGVVAGVRWLAPRWKLMDKPDARKVHAAPIPLGGGLGIWAGLIGCFALGSLMVLSLSPASLPEELAGYQPGLLAKVGELWWLLAGGTLLMLLGLADDRYGLGWKVRLLIEATVAAGVVFGLELQLTAFIESRWLTAILSILWIVALINSFNMLDNMDGLSGGVAFLAALILAVMLLGQPDPAHQQPQVFVASLLLVLCGSLLGFLVHNWPPARIFMGDAGSYLVGYWIAVATLLTTYTGYRSSQPHAIIAPLCILAIPLYDMTSVILIRLREGRSPFEADRRHFSHRLVELGLSKKQAVLTIYLATMTCGLSSLLLNRTDGVGAGIIVLMVLSILGLIAVLESLSRKKDA